MASTEFAKIFDRLREMLASQAASLSVSEDGPTRYCLEGCVGPATIKAWGGKKKVTKIPVAWVQIGKAYVSLHLMGVADHPRHDELISPELKARMQGKSCFNFNLVDERLFKELQVLIERANLDFRKAGFIE